jgi:PIN domain nuclease of toxin-antitoxin system
VGLGVKVLLDTCAYIWLCSEPEKFTQTAASVLQNGADVALYLSEATILEIALKHATGKLELPDVPRKWIPEQIKIWGIIPIPLLKDILFLSAELPWHHRDPFDRLIIATAKEQQLPVITSDSIFADYDIDIIW